MRVPVLLLLSSLAAMAQQSYPDARATDPVALGWMKGFPPPPDKLIRFEDGSAQQFPKTRWAFSNYRQLVPSKLVSTGGSPASVLPKADLTAKIDALTFQPLGGGPAMTWAKSIEANYTDGIVVLHNGRIVYEKYLGALAPAGQHIAFSVTKSIIATLGATLVHEGLIDVNATVSRYVPELQSSGFGDATIRQLLDMTTGIRYSEVYTDPNSPIWQFSRANGFLPRPPGYQGPQSSYAYLPTVGKEYGHGERFVYKTVNTDVLGWVMSRVTGKSLTALVQERFWSRIGAEQDAFFLVDFIGIEFAGGGFNCSLRDLARWGEMMRLKGKYNGHQIVPAAVIEDTQRGASKEQFAKGGYATLPGWSYRNMWWVSHNDHGVFMARGIHGQALYVDPKAGMVIARFASHPIAGNVGIDPNSLPAYEAVARFLLSTR